MELMKTDLGLGPEVGNSRNFLIENEETSDEYEDFDEKDKTTELKDKTVDVFTNEEKTKRSFYKRGGK
jgi:hypothetical protein